MQTVCILRTVCQPLGERVAAGVTQCCMFSALKTSLSQQNRPDLTHRLTPLLLPGEETDIVTETRPNKVEHTQLHSYTPAHSRLLLSLVGESLSEFVESSRVLRLDVASTAEKLGEV